ncbi:hypothetical protein [Herbaspirillum sp.]|uniref:hypothetical protein n=1 Tax=Herbaspirillum sp. TaxID=1890675 RepID=UPI001B12C388|nr:hypothetical protein [Herbaspirillum sp.]MBO9535560.1 hypothetical protein [Herbaspirillum sp.]
MKDPNKNNIPLYFDAGRSIFNVVTWALLNFLVLLLVSLFVGLYFKVQKGISTDADVASAFKIAFLVLIPLNWFYWKTKMKDGKWRYLFYRDWK